MIRYGARYSPSRSRNSTSIEEWTPDGVLRVEVLGRFHLLEMAAPGFFADARMWPAARISPPRWCQVLREGMPKPL